MVFRPWLLCEAAREGLPFLFFPLFLFLFTDTNYILRVPGCYAKQPGWSTVCRAQAGFLVLGCSRGSQEGGLRCSALRRGGFWSLFLSFPHGPPSAVLGRGFWSLAAREAARRAVYGVPRSAGVVFGPWLLCKAARKGFLFLSLSPSFLFFIYTNYLLRLPGCYAKQPGGSTVCGAWRARFSVPGCSRGSQRGGLRCSALGGRGFWSLAARAAGRGAVNGVPRSAGVVFGPWLLCEAARKGLPFLSLLLFFFCLLILTLYLGSLAATRSGQGGLRSAALRRGFRSLAACAAARGRSTVCRPGRAYFSVPGCVVKQPGKVCCSLPFPPSFFVS